MPASHRPRFAGTSRSGSCQPPRDRRTATAHTSEEDVARLRLVVSLRRLGLGPEDAGRMARLCLERGEVDRDLLPLLAAQRAAIARQRDDLDRLDAELVDLEETMAAAGRAQTRRKEHPMSDSPIRVLFVCTGNSARSQIAEAVLRRQGGADFEVFSAGTEPKGVNPYTVRVLADAGIDWSGARSKSVDGFLGQSFDYVVTVCDRARQSCPVFPGPTTHSIGGSRIRPRSKARTPTGLRHSSAHTSSSISGCDRSSRSPCVRQAGNGARRSQVDDPPARPGAGRRGDRDVRPRLRRLRRHRGRHRLATRASPRHSVWPS